MGMDEIWADYEDLKSENEELKQSLKTLLAQTADLKNITEKLINEKKSLTQANLSLQKEFDELKFNYTKLQNQKENKRMENEITQWEYKIVPNFQRDEKNLNDLGTKGWEALPGTPDGSIIMKRPKQTKQDKDLPNKRDNYPSYER